MRRPLVITIALTAGCSFTSDPSGTSFRCEMGPCPEGFRCVDGVCVEGEGPPDAATVIDAGEADATTNSADARLLDAGEVDICFEATQAPNTDDCSAASLNVTDAARAGGTTVYGDTTTYINDLGSPTSECLGFITAGVDAFYRVDALAGETLTAHLYGAEYDTVLYLAGGCTTGVECFEGDDNTLGTDETVAYVPGANTTVYVVVDTAGTGKGCYALDISLTGP